MPKFPSVDHYLSAQPEATRPLLERVRRTIRKALPKAEETIAYNIPAYKLNGCAVVYFAGWKRHFSLYPTTKRLQQQFAKELAAYDIDKGTVRFPLDAPVPVKLLTAMAKFRAKEEAERKST